MQQPSSRVRSDRMLGKLASRYPLTRLAWISIAAALATIAIKTLAWALTDSVGFLSDAAESVVNLAAAVMALLILHWVARPADAEHMYGHEKAEYFSAGAEGTMICIAAAGIGYAAIQRLLNPVHLQDVGIGVAVSVCAAALNLFVARLLIHAGTAHASLTLEADGRHLMTDVWTSAGVVVGVAAVGITGWETLDPLIALAVAANIVVTGIRLMRRSAAGLMDRALSGADLAKIDTILERYARPEIQFHALRTRRAGRRSFVTFHLLVPGSWTVRRGHDLVEQIEDDLHEVLVNATVTVHLEPIEDPRSFEDVGLDRRASARSAPASSGTVRAHHKTR
jgi:cation diffusion facilitator family transporter